MNIFSQIMTYLNGEDLQKYAWTKSKFLYMYDAYDLVKDLQTIVVGPLALSILALFILLEFQRIPL